MCFSHNVMAVPCAIGVAASSLLERKSIAYVLFLYTDGAVEAENQAGEQYSATRLAKIASMYSQQSADELVETIYRSITEFRGTKLLADDLTLVVLKAC